MNSRRKSSIVANPILIGATTVLVVVVAVFLSYNANNGLPLVPGYELRAEVPNASGLIKGNEVRQGGARIGVVSSISPLVARDGSSAAMLHLKLDQSGSKLPLDSRVQIRQRSALGLKYVALAAGTARRTYPQGATIPLRQAGEKPVELDAFFGMFDAPTRKGSAASLVEFGNALAGRGSDLNDAFSGLRELADRGDSVGRNLNDPRAGWSRFFPALEQAATEVAPVSTTQGELFKALDTTFAAWASVADDVKDTISTGPPALDAATRELPAQAGFVDDTTELFRRLNPAFVSLAAASPGLSRAFAAGIPSLRRAPALNRRLVSTLDDLEAFAGDDRVPSGLKRLSRTASLLEPTLAFATPAQTQCNYLALFFRNLGSALSESDQVGSFLRFGVLAVPQTPGSEAGPAATPADGPSFTDAQDPTHLKEDSFLHSNPYPNTAAPGQTSECEAGAEGYAPGRRAIGNVPGNQGKYAEATGSWKPR